MAFDVEGIRHAVLISDVAAQFGVRLKQKGEEWMGLCPFHQEKTPSFHIFVGDDRAQRFKCFGCDAKGDVLDFVQQIKGVTLPQAAEILGGSRGYPDNRDPVPMESVDPYAAIQPADHKGSHPFAVGRSSRLYNPKKNAWGVFTPSLIHEYRGLDGELLGLVMRRDMDGKKETPQVRFVRLPSGEECWARVPFDKPRPLYGLHALSGDQVFVLEGEKCRDKFASKVRRVAVAWPGGAGGVPYVDWSPLYGKDVLLLGDADGPGSECMRAVAALLRPHGGTQKIFDIAGRIVNG